MTNWTTQNAGNKPDFSALFKEDYAVLLLRGKNSFKNSIFSYVKISLPNIKRLYETMRDGLPFNPSDFGEVVAAGTGEPSAQVHAEVAAAYPIIDQNTGSPHIYAPNAQADETPKKKSWDEY